jgi:hypothetical protein
MRRPGESGGIFSADRRLLSLPDHRDETTHACQRPQAKAEASMLCPGAQSGTMQEC